MPDRISRFFFQFNYFRCQLIDGLSCSLNLDYNKQSNKSCNGEKKNRRAYEF